MNIDPNALVEQLCAAASIRKAQTIRLIAAICEEQIERGSNDFSIATIGRLSSDRGGPSAAAIRNKPGEDYRALIKTFAISIGGNDRKKRHPQSTESEALLEGVNDPVLKVRIKLLLAELSSLRAQLLATRHLANRTAVIELPSPESGEQTSSGKANTGGDLRLTLQEVTALEAAIAPTTLKHWGWEIDVTGRIATDQGQTVFRAGFATAIQKTVAHSADF